MASTVMWLLTNWYFSAENLEIFCGEGWLDSPVGKATSERQIYWFLAMWRVVVTSGLSPDWFPAGLLSNEFDKSGAKFSLSPKP